ncbi:MAG: radical SAM/SPASM domain-containing protein [bacterium]
MGDKYKIDSHKLIYHVSRVNDWLAGKTIYPLYMEISPSGTCNHRCTYCALDFMEYQRRFLDAGLLKERLSEMGGLGLKSVMFAGEGEPFLHNRMAEIINHTRQSGIDVGITSNGVLLKEDLFDQIRDSVEWIKISINGATRETYARVHRAKPADFDLVIKNLSYAAGKKRETNGRCTLGMQLLLLPENRHEALPLARLAREIGMDYLVVKPYSQHPQSKTDQYRDIKYGDYVSMAEELARLNSPDFSVIFRTNTMRKWDSCAREYKHCFALPFWSYMDAGGNIWGCSIYLEDERFFYGNIYENSFQKIWTQEKRLKSLQWVEAELDTGTCRVNCRMDEVNRYLWDLKNPPEHVNFI